MRYLIPLLLLAACDDDNGLNQPEPPPAPSSSCRVCDVTFVSCGGFGPFEIGYIEECTGDGCACEAAPCQGLPVFNRNQLVCGILLGL